MNSVVRHFVRRQRNLLLLIVFYFYAILYMNTELSL